MFKLVQIKIIHRITVSWWIIIILALGAEWISQSNKGPEKVESEPSLSVLLLRLISLGSHHSAPGNYASSYSSEYHLSACLEEMAAPYTACQIQIFSEKLKREISDIAPWRKVPVNKIETLSFTWWRKRRTNAQRLSFGLRMSSVEQLQTPIFSDVKLTNIK